jgi:hypothetical protein
VFVPIAPPEMPAIPPVPPIVVSAPPPPPVYGGNPYETAPVSVTAPPATAGSVSAATPVEAIEAEAPEQTTRYLRVANATGQDLTVRVIADGIARPLEWKVPAGKTSYLAVGGKPLAAGEVYIWAESATSSWLNHKNRALKLVAAPYRGHAIDTFTHTFTR